jgi:hypothetical protein
MQTPRTDLSGETSRFSRPVARARATSHDRTRADVPQDRRRVPLARPSPTAAQLVRAGLLLAAGLAVFAVGLRGGAAGAQEAHRPTSAQMVNPDR